MSTVLVIDDDPHFLDKMEEMLAGAGYEVFTALDGLEGVKLLERQHRTIDVAIVDLSLPGINGFEIIGAISRRPSDIKIIATTGVYKDNHLGVAETLGAHALIRKPPAGVAPPANEWLEIVRQLVGNKARKNRAGAGDSAGQDCSPGDLN